MTSSRRLEELRAEARYHRERCDIYRAKAYGPRATSPFRLKELERVSVFAEARLRRAQQEQQADAERRRGHGAQAGHEAQAS
jgi:hypothetical protein